MKVVNFTSKAPAVIIVQPSIKIDDRSIGIQYSGGIFYASIGCQHDIILSKEVVIKMISELKKEAAPPVVFKCIVGKKSEAPSVENIIEGYCTFFLEESEHVIIGSQLSAYPKKDYKIVEVIAEGAGEYFNFVDRYERVKKEKILKPYVVFKKNHIRIAEIPKILKILQTILDFYKAEEKAE